MGLFSPQVIEALVEIVTGGHGMRNEPPKFGVYRSGSELERFLGECGLQFRVGFSRESGVRTVLTEANDGDDPEEALGRIIGKALDQRSFADFPNKRADAVSHLNECLRPDEYEVRPYRHTYKLLPLGPQAPVIGDLEQAAAELDLDAIQRETGRALAQAETDPPDAITAACSMIESTCKSILRKMGQALPDNQDISHLARAVRDHLSFSPQGERFSADLIADMTRILNGLSNVAGGIGAVRTKLGCVRQFGLHLVSG
jgi:hypothetical protein